jgi:hypothetical protein
MYCFIFPYLSLRYISSKSKISSKEEITNTGIIVDDTLLQDFLGKVMSDLGGAYSAVLVYVGDKLGLYKAMAEADDQAITSEQLASKTGTIERCVREWLANQAAGGYIKYDPFTQKYSLPKEHAMVLVDENSTAYSMGGFQGTVAFFKDIPKVIEAFRTG